MSTTTTDYDFNLYAPEDGVLTLTAYEYTRRYGEIATASDRDVLTLTVRATEENRDTVRWLLTAFFGAEDGDATVHEDLDAWSGVTETFTAPTAPKVVRDFVALLPEYEY